MVKANCFLLFVFLMGCNPKPKPTILVVGDSISLQYGPGLMEKWKDKYSYQRILKPLSLNVDPDHENVLNGEDSANVLDLIREFGDHFGYPNNLLVNAGLHDIKTGIENGKRQIEPADYRSNLESIVNWCRYHGVRMIWITTTPVDDKIHNSLQDDFSRFNSDVITYNEIALEVMEEFDVPVIDLYAFILQHSKDLYMDHVHFKEEIRNVQAEFIAREVEKLINR